MDLTLLDKILDKDTITGPMALFVVAYIAIKLLRALEIERGEKGTRNGRRKSRDDASID